MTTGLLRSCGYLGAALVVAVLAGCGSSSPSGSEPAGQVMASVRTEAMAAKSVHISGSVKDGSSTITLNMSFDGPDFFGTVQEDGADIAMQAASGKIYVKLTSGFMKITKLPAATATAFCAKYCGRYVELPAANAAELVGNVSLKALVGKAFSANAVAQAKQSTIEFVPATLNGQPVLQATDGGYRLDVTTGSAHYPLLWAGKGQRIVFSEWNSATTPAPPPAKDVLSLSTLSGA